MRQGWRVFGSYMTFAGTLLVVLSFTGLAVSRSTNSAAPAKPPPSKVEEVKEVLHGVEIIDRYRWLEDQNAPETREWIKAQNEYTESLLGPRKEREYLRERLAQYLKIDTIGMPVEAGGRYFFAKRKADQDLSVIYMRQGLTGKDEVLIDPHPLSPDKTVSVSLLDVSPDGKLMAYGVRSGGEDEIVVRFFDVDARKDLADVFPRARYFGVQITPDRSGVYYTHFDKAVGPRVYYHVLGKPMSEDVELFGKGYGPDKIISASLSEDGKHLLLTVMYGSAAKKTEVWYMDAIRRGPIQPIVNDIEARFIGRFAGDLLLLQTNWQAPNGRILKVDLKNPARSDWKEIVPESKSALVGVSPVGGKLFANYLENVNSRVKIFDLNGKHLGDIAFPSLGTVSGISGWWTKPEAFYSFSSFLVPSTIYRYDTATGETSEWARIQVPIDTDRFEVRQVRYPSKDGTMIPMFLVYPKGLKLDGNNPTLLTGYGGFNISRTATFSALAAIWVENGGVFALPNLRGGGEFGEEWHRAGMLEKKQNTFDDFIAAAEWLIANKYTRPEKLAISGGSNGGLLVGAALTQRPELFQAVVCSVPLLDMLRYHKFLVARFWVPEYGSAEDPEQFKYLYAYSPYHRVKPGVKYPAVLFITGDADTRVDPLHARKMTALLQAATGSDRPILLHYDTKAGHSGGKPISKTIDDLSYELTFLFWQLGVEVHNRK
ncbi:MAG: prolyl oligopeptidase family serine peptidase [Gemmatales bacterium]|nr:prolyl oligopeptidase family serine peptidase [Gemmatales bacterium]MDW8385457.1 prolyl oligopeptidase family serine peptidase [Gemmatales bacterium]